MNGTKTAGAVVVRAGEGQSVHWGPAGIVRVIASADSTDGSFSIVEATEPPGSAAPLHTHHGEAEGFYILAGQLELTCGDETVAAGAGDFIHAPRGVPHKYFVTGDQPARVLLIFSRPGFESFFLDGGTPLGQKPAGPPTPAQMQQLFQRYDLEVHESMPH